MEDIRDILDSLIQTPIENALQRENEEYRKAVEDVLDECPSAHDFRKCWNSWMLKYKVEGQPSSVIYHY